MTDRPVFQITNEEVTSAIRALEARKEYIIDAYADEVDKDELLHINSLLIKLGSLQWQVETI